MAPLEDRDRDVLIRLEQQLQNINQNQGQILIDLRTIFDRLEQETKVVTVLSGDLKAHVESSILRWTNVDKRLEEIERRLTSSEKRAETNEDSIATEREERIKALTDEKEARTADNKERETFENEIKTSARVINWIIGALASLAAVVSLYSVFHK